MGPYLPNQKRFSLKSWLKGGLEGKKETVILLLANKPEQWLNRSQQRVMPEQVQVL